MGKGDDACWCQCLYIWWLVEQEWRWTYVVIVWSADDEMKESCTIVFVVLLTPSQRSRFIKPWYWTGGAIGRYECTPSIGVPRRS